MRDDFDLGKAIEDSGENHAGHENARFIGPAENPPQLVFRFFLGQIIGEARAARRMHPDRHIEFRRFLEDGQEIGLVERTAIHVGKNLHADGAKIFYGALDLFYRGGGIIHRQGGHKSGKAIRMFGDELGQAVIGDFGEFRRLFADRRGLRSGGSGMQGT